jgi:hypothetical protein
LYETVEPALDPAIVDPSLQIGLTPAVVLVVLVPAAGEPPLPPPVGDGGAGTDQSSVGKHFI